MKLPVQKRIKVIDITGYADFHEYNPILDILWKYAKGEFPCLFLDGAIKRGGSIKPEMQGYLMSYLAKDFVIKRAVKGMYAPKPFCQYERTWWGGKRLVCSEPQKQQQ